MSNFRWQFSVRGLLLLTAVVAAFLTLAVRFPELLFIVALASAFLVTTFVKPFGWVPYLISERQPRVARLTWIATGSFLGAVGAMLVWAWVLGVVEGAMPTFLLVIFYVFVAVLCYRSAWRVSARPVEHEND